MAIPFNYNSLIEDKDIDDLSKFIANFVTANRGNFFTFFNIDPYLSVKAIFNNLRMAYDGNRYKDISKIKGNQSESGLIVALTNQLKKVRLVEGTDESGLQSYYNDLLRSIESYGLLLALNNNLVSPDKASDSYTLGNFCHNLMARFDNRVMYANPNKQSYIQMILATGLHLRNKEFHSPVNTRSKSHVYINYIYQLLLFMIGANFMCFEIYRNRFGGLRYRSNVNGKLELYLDNGLISKKELNVTETNYAKFGSQFLSIYQIPLKQEFEKGSVCKCVFTPDQGKAVEHEFKVTNREFVEFSYKMNNDKNNPDTGSAGGFSADESADDSNDCFIIPDTKTFIPVEQLESIDFNGGKYTGPLNPEGLPEGRGLFIQKMVMYKGLFTGGRPDGRFSVKSLSEKNPFTFVGYLDNEFKPIKGTLDLPGSNRTFEGDFRGWSCTHGKKHHGKTLIYEGDFSLAKKIDGRMAVVYHGKGKLYTSKFIHDGEFAFGQISGLGTRTYTDPGLNPQTGIWDNEIYLGPADDNDFIKDNQVDIAGSGQTSENVTESLDVSGTVLVNIILPDVSMRINAGDKTIQGKQGEVLNLEVDPGTQITALIIYPDGIPAEPVHSFCFTAPDEAGELTEWNLKEEFLSGLENNRDEFIHTGELPFDGGIFTGSYNVYGQPHGHGEVKYPNGETYSGDFSNGVREGYGVLVTSRLTYTGGFKNGLYHGNGCITRYGEKTEGYFNEGKKCGRFITTKRNGQIREELWDNNELISTN